MIHFKGQCEIDFGKWFSEKENSFDFFNRNSKPLAEFVFQNAALEFFDSKSIFINIKASYIRETFYYTIPTNSGYYSKDGFKTRKECLIHALEAANEIYNDEHGN